MSTQVFPSLPLLAWPVKRSSLSKRRKPESISGKRTTIFDWSYPRWQWELTFQGLRQAGANQQTTSWRGQAFAEFATLAGFANQMNFGGDSFLFADPDDNTSPTDQPIGIGDGVTMAFPLVRNFGGFIEPILAPNVVTNVKVNGAVQTPGTAYGVSLWGSASPGIVTFVSAPALGAAITSTFGFYFPCQFDDDTLTFSKFMSALYEAKSVKFSSLK